MSNILSEQKSAAQTTSSVPVREYFTDEYYTKMDKYLRRLLHRNASGWIREAEIDDIIIESLEYVYEKRTDFKPELGYRFSAWSASVAHNRAIDLAKQMKKDADRTVSLSSFSEYSESRSDEQSGQCERKKKSVKTVRLADPWVMDTIGIDEHQFDADSTITRIEEEKASEKRMTALLQYMDEDLKESERQMTKMMIDGFSKEAMMQTTGKSGSSIDTCKCRTREKVRNWMKDSDYYGIE